MKKTLKYITIERLRLFTFISSILSVEGCNRLTLFERTMGNNFMTLLTR